MKQLIILPGWGGTKETWNNFIKIASQKYEVICLNLPCFGDAPCPNEVWGVEEYAKFVKNKIQELNLLYRNLDSSVYQRKYPRLSAYKHGGKRINADNNADLHRKKCRRPILQKPIVLGHSFGGQIAVYLAVHYPKLISKLVLSGPAVIRPKNILKRIILGLIAKCGKIIFKLPVIEKFDVLIKKILYYFINSPDYIKTSGIKRDIFKKIIRQDLIYLLHKINIPTLIIWGTRDGYVPLSDGKKIARLIPNAKLEIIKNGKHGLHLQCPEKLLEVILRFTNY